MSRPLLQGVSGLGTTRGVSPDDQQHKLKQWPRRHILFSDHVLTRRESNKIRGFIISSLSDTCINWNLFFQDRTIKRLIRVLQLPCGCSRRHKILGEPPHSLALSSLFPRATTTLVSPTPSPRISKIMGFDLQRRRFLRLINSKYIYGTIVSSFHFISIHFIAPSDLRIRPRWKLLTRYSSTI
jgi:hypothetical protein